MNGRQLLLLLFVWYPFWVLVPGGWLLDQLGPQTPARWWVAASMFYIYGMLAPIIWSMLRTEKREGGRT